MTSRPRSPDFGRLAARYDDVRPVDDNWRAVYEVVVREAELRGARVLDLGCGTGRLAARLDADGIAKVWGVDASAEMLEVARAKAPGVGWKLARAEALPFRDGWFDAVVAWLVVHLLDRPAAFAEAARVLRRDGRLAVVTFDPAHFDRFWLNRFFPSLERIDRARFPTGDDLAAELEAAGLASPRLLRLSHAGSLPRAEALRRVRERHISTFDLMDEAEVIDGIARAERELPDPVAWTIEWLVAVAARASGPSPGTSARRTSPRTSP